MKVKNLGYDPDLGKKFLSENDGKIIGRGRSIDVDDEDEDEDDEDDPLAQFMTEQEMHDELMPDVPPPEQGPETEAEAARLGALRMEQMKHQNKQLRKKR